MLCVDNFNMFLSMYCDAGPCVRPASWLNQATLGKYYYK